MAEGYYGEFGGSFVPETLVAPLEELRRSYLAVKEDKSFREELSRLLSVYAGRPTPLFFSEKLSANCGCSVYLKREDMCHTGAHKINNALGQGLLARRMGKRKIIAETGAGQHGVATATVAALLGMECTVFMGSEDMSRQSENVFRMELLGARVQKVEEGSRTLKEASSAALREWTSDPDNLYYLLGSCVGPHPYPMMVRDFQKIIGEEVKAQIEEEPTCLVACVGGGSNSIGLFYPYMEEESVRLVGVEAQGAASLSMGKIGVLHGSKSYLLYDEDGQIINTHSIAPGLDYSGVGPEHSYLKYTRRAEYYTVGDAQALEAFRWLASGEGIIPALESSHAIAWVLAGRFSESDVVVVNLSGRGEKDLKIVRSR